MGRRKEGERMKSPEMKEMRERRKNAGVYKMKHADSHLSIISLVRHHHHPLPNPPHLAYNPLLEPHQSAPAPYPLSPSSKSFS
jgi:hypothetical protein